MTTPTHHAISVSPPLDPSLAALKWRVLSAASARGHHCGAFVPFYLKVPGDYISALRSTCDNCGGQIVATLDRELTIPPACSR